jgi:HEPN domain-containing protein
MTNTSLAESYLIKARVRLEVLEVYLDKEAYSDVVREAQEIVELALKGMLRQVGMEPPHWHDVGRLVREHRDRFPGVTDAGIERLTRVSTALRKERELAFYGAIDFIPTDEYTREQAEEALDDATWVVSVAAHVISPG